MTEFLTVEDSPLLAAGSFNQTIYFEINEIRVHSGKGDKDRLVPLPKSIKPALKIHLERVKLIHENDLSKGCGEVYLPNALGRKYLKAGKEWGWIEPLSGRLNWQVLLSALHPIHSGILLRHTFCRQVLISGQFKAFWGIMTFLLQ